MFQALFANCCCDAEGESRVPLQFAVTLRDRERREYPLDRGVPSVPESIEPRGDTFNVELNLEGDVKIGMGIRMVPELAVLRVELLQDRGAVAAWNLAHPERKVEKGDHIVQVNDLKGDLPLMVRECSRSRNFVLKCRHPPK